RAAHGVVARFAHGVKAQPPTSSPRRDPTQRCREQVAIPQRAQDATHHRGGHHVPLAAQQHHEFVLAPARKLLAQPVHGGDHLARPGGPAHPQLTLLMARRGQDGRVDWDTKGLPAGWYDSQTVLGGLLLCQHPWVVVSFPPVSRRYPSELSWGAESPIADAVAHHHPGRG